MSGKGDIGLDQTADDLFVPGGIAMTLDKEVVFTIVVRNGEGFSSLFREMQFDTIAHHTGKNEAHIPAQAVLIEHQAKQQITGHAKTL